MKALSDFFFKAVSQPYMQFSARWNSNALEDLKQAIQQALGSGELFDPRATREDAGAAAGRCRRSRWTS